MDMEGYYRILLDTNIFFLPFEEKFDSINELKNFLLNNDIRYKELITLKKNIWEIENKLNTAKSNKKKILYKMILSYIEKNNITIIESPLNINTDRLILKYTIENPDVIPCTRDSKLIFVFKKLKINFIYYKNKSYFIKIF